MIVPVVLPESTRIENFRILRRLGRGGFGITYVAAEYSPSDSGVDADTPSREVVIKEFFPRHIARRLNGHTVSPEPDIAGADQAFRSGMRAFLKEARAIMALEHDNIVHIHRVLEANGTAYFTMSFLRGETLRAILKREGSLSEERARRLLLPILNGLTYAHSKGVLHRDLKPENIMVRESDGRTVLIDFGCARMDVVSDASQYTRLTDLVAYTPGYAALEQYARAASTNVHGAFTDIYGLAAVLYEAVTGKCPPESAQRATEVYGGRLDTLTPASVLLFEVPGYGRAFLGAIDWGLELASQDRPKTMLEFRDALNGRLALPDKTLRRLEGFGGSEDATTLAAPTIRATASPTTRPQQVSVSASPPLVQTPPSTLQPTSPPRPDEEFSDKTLRRPEGFGGSEDATTLATPTIRATASPTTRPQQVSVSASPPPVQTPPSTLQPTSPARPDEQIEDSHHAFINGVMSVELATNQVNEFPAQVGEGRSDNIGSSPGSKSRSHVLVAVLVAFAIVATGVDTFVYLNHNAATRAPSPVHLSQVAIPEARSDLTTNGERFSYAVGYKVGKNIVSNTPKVNLDIKALDEGVEEGGNGKIDAAKLSYTIGNDVGRGLSDKVSKEDLDLNAIKLGVEEGIANVPSRIDDKIRKDLMAAEQVKIQHEIAANEAAQSEKNKEDGDKFLADNGKKPNVKTTALGLQYEVETEGSGDHPGLTDSVTVNYKGTLLDGTVFDSTYERKEPAKFRVDQVIRGWSDGLRLMTPGSKYKFYVPSALAYGDNSPTPKIPAGSTLVFEVELLSVNKTRH